MVGSMTTNHRRTGERLTRRQMRDEILFAAEVLGADPAATAITLRRASLPEMRRGLGRSRRVLRELPQELPRSALLPLSGGLILAT